MAKNQKLVVTREIKILLQKIQLKAPAMAQIKWQVKVRIKDVTNKKERRNLNE